MASATSLTASKISSLLGFGFRRSRFSLTSAFSSALLCSGSGPFLFCRERSASRQNCRSLLPFIQFSFSGKTAGAAEQLPRRNGPNRKTHPTCAAQQTTNTPQRTGSRTPKELNAHPADLQACSVGLMGLNYSHRRGPQKRPQLYAPHLITRSSVLEATLSKRTCQRTCRTAVTATQGKYRAICSLCQ